MHLVGFFLCELHYEYDARIHEHQVYSVLTIMELAGSLPCLQEPAIDPVLSQVNPLHIPATFLIVQLQYYPPFYSRVFRGVSSPHIVRPKARVHL